MEAIQPKKEKKGGRLRWILLGVFLALAFTAAIILIVVGKMNETFPEIPQTDEEKSPVFTVGDETVTYDLYRYYFLGYKNLMSGGDDSYFEDKDTAAIYAEIDERVRADIARLYASLALAERLGVTDREIDEIYDELLRLTRSGGEFAGMVYDGFESEEAYKKSLAENNMSDAVYRLVLRAYAAEYEASAAFAVNASEYLSSKDEDMYAFFMGEDAVHVAYAYIDKGSFLNTDGAYELALIAEARLGEVAHDLSAFIRTAIQYSSPSVSTVSLEKGMYLTRYHASGSAQENLTEIAFSLAAGEMSGIIETDEGYFILRRMNTTEEDLRAADRELLYEGYFANHFYRMLHESTESLLLQMTETDFYATLTFETVGYTED